jgi:hypothetical protein
MENTKKDINNRFPILPIIYRPDGCPFLDDCFPNIFWTIRRSVEEDFPDCVIKEYDIDDLTKYLVEKKLPVKKIKLYI